MRAAFALLAAPLAAALSLYNPQKAFGLAADLLGDGGTSETVLSPASDMKLSSIPGDDFYVLTHELYPNHRVRIKSTDGWCDPDVKSYTGYFDVGGGKNLFFYFFESRDKPSEDPVVMWINGGPGASSAMGLFMELGPCTINDKPKHLNDTTRNPYSWNEKANIFFIDEPVGVGYSYAKNGQVVATTEEAAQDIAAFMAMFFDTFKEFQGRPLHLAGESYGGRYLPVFASAVYDNNRVLKAAGKEPINLESVLIGNGVTDFYTSLDAYFPFSCTVHAGINETILSISECVQLAELIPKCRKMLSDNCIATRDWTQCAIALMYCESTVMASYEATGRNPYDATKMCGNVDGCYTKELDTVAYLNLPEVQEKLGVDKERKHYESGSMEVGMAFFYSLDAAGQTWLYVTQLLERGIRVLNYAGTNDWICNYIGNQAWMEKLEWHGKAGYNAAKMKQWDVDGTNAGEFKLYENLTFLKIWGAGHLVPMDQPEHSLTFFNAWLKNEFGK